MTLKWIILVVGLVLINTGCYAQITGTVVDAETGVPIEGAVVLVEWTITKGLPGLSYHESYKVVEAITDQAGKVTILGISNPLVDPPDVTIYKKSYVAWNNKYIFPDYKKRTDFKWQNACIFKLEIFKGQYSFTEHQAFIAGAAHVELSTEKKQLFLKNYNQGERENVIKERQEKKN
jgi:hypothetical protein